MALIFHSGFELGDFGEWDSVIGSPSVQEVVKKTGDYAMRCDTIGGAAISKVDANVLFRRFSFYLRIATAPNSDASIFHLSSVDASTCQCFLKLTTAREIDVYDGVGKQGDGSTVIPLNTWTRISGAINETNNTVSIWIEGDIEHNAISVSASYSNFQGIGIATSVTADLYFDDIVLDDTSDTLTDIGDIRVARASPNAIGEYAQYDSVSGYGNVDEIPANDADFIEDNGSDAARESYNIPNLADLDGASSGDTVKAVAIWIRGDADGGGGTDHKAMVRDDGSDYESADLDFDSIAWFSWYLALMPKDSAAWTETRFNALQIGAYHLGNQDQRVHCLVAMVAYILSAVATALELRSSTNTDARLAFTSALSLAFKSTTDTDARLTISTAPILALRSSNDTAARLALAAVISPELRSSSDTRADVVLETTSALALRSSSDTRANLTIKVAPRLELRSSTDTRADITFDTLVSLAFKSSTDTRADLTLTIPAPIALELRSSSNTRAALTISVTVVTELTCRSSTDTRADIDLDTLIALALRSVSDSVARLALSILIALVLKSSTDTRVVLALTSLIELVLRASTETRAALELTIAAATELELRSETDIRAAIALQSLIVLALASQTTTRAALALTLGITKMTYHTLNMSLPSRELTAAIADRNLNLKVKQNG